MDSMAKRDETLGPEDVNGRARVDENGVDLDQLDSFLRLTPAERLRQLEEFAQFVLIARRAQGCNDDSLHGPAEEVA